MDTPEITLNPKEVLEKLPNLRVFQAVKRSRGEVLESELQRRLIAMSYEAFTDGHVLHNVLAELYLAGLVMRTGEGRHRSAQLTDAGWKFNLAV